MKLVGLMPVRNEAWCLGFTLRVALKWCDEVVVLLHDTNDASPQILEDVFIENGRNRERVSWFYVPGEWREMEHRQKMLDLSRVGGATHVAIVDADEFLTGNLVGSDEYTSVRWHARGLKPGMLLELPGYNLRAWPVDAVTRTTTATEVTVAQDWRKYHANGVWGNRWFATAFQDSPALHWAGDRFHHREPMGCGWHRWRPIKQGDGGTLHLWGASERRLRAKHALYRMTERLRWPAKPSAKIEYTYDPATNPDSQLARDLRVAGPWTFKAVPASWLEPYADLMQYLDIYAEPWQENEVLTLLMIHGREKFAGLDLLGY